MKFCVANMQITKLWIATLYQENYSLYIHFVFRRSTPNIITNLSSCIGEILLKLLEEWIVKWINTYNYTTTNLPIYDDHYLVMISRTHYYPPHFKIPSINVQNYAFDHWGYWPESMIYFGDDLILQKITPSSEALFSVGGGQGGSSQGGLQQGGCLTAPLK